MALYLPNAPRSSPATWSVCLVLDRRLTAGLSEVHLLKKAVKVGLIKTTQVTDKLKLSISSVELVCYNPLWVCHYEQYCSHYSYSFDVLFQKIKENSAAVRFP